MCDTPDKHVESYVQKTTTDINKEFDWLSLSIFPIPLDIQTNESSGTMDMFFARFNLAGNKFRIPDNEKPDLLPYALTGADQNYYMSNVGQCSNVVEVGAMIRRAYNSDARQLQVVRSPEELPFRKFTTEKKSFTPPMDSKKLLITLG